MGMGTNSIMADTTLKVPFYVFVWGFLGGVSWCIYCAAQAARFRLFDRYHLAWYFAHPWISAILGGAVACLVLGGLSGLGAMKSEDNVALATLLSLVSFVAGYSTTVVWKVLDKAVRKIFGDPDPIQRVHEQAQDHLLQNLKS